MMGEFILIYDSIEVGRVIVEGGEVFLGLWAGRSMTVVRTLRVRVDRVQFSAPRLGF